MKISAANPTLLSPLPRAERTDRGDRFTPSGEIPLPDVRQMARRPSELSQRLDDLFAQAANSPNPVLASMEPVIRNASHVKIELAAIKKQAASLTPDQLRPANWKFPPYKPDDDERAVAFFMVMNSINFLFFDPHTQEKFKVNVGGKEFSGADGMVASLNRALDQGVPILDSNYLAHVKPEEMAHIFRGNIELPLLKERTDIFNEVGRVLNEKYEGSFSNLLQAADNRAFNHGDGIVERLTRDFPSFRDGCPGPEGEPVVFNKRAQLAVGMLASRLAGSGRFECPDVNQLTVFADYQLPRGLRAMGVLNYDEALASKVDNSQPIAKGSKMEQEMRASTIVAARLLMDELKKRSEFSDLDARGLDSFLWSQARKDKDSKPHITVTTAY